MLKLLQYCNYKIIVMEIKLMLLLLICTKSKRDSGTKLPVLNLVNHLPKPWTNRFAQVNGKQLLKTNYNKV